MGALWGYLDRNGFQLDCLLNTLRGCRKENTPISLSAAEAEQAYIRGQTANPWGCWVCRWLSWTVERHHCFFQLRGKSTRRPAAIWAGLQLLFVAFVLGALMYWGVIPALVRGVGWS